MVKTCPICGEEFEPNHGNRKYCSEECYDVVRKKYYRQYRDEHKEELRERGRKYYQEHKEEKREISRKYYREHREELLEHKRQQRRLSYLSSSDKEINAIDYEPDNHCIRLGYSCLECPYEDCRYDHG